MRLRLRSVCFFTTQTPNRLKQETNQQQTDFNIPELSVNDAHLVCGQTDSYYLFNKKGVLLPDWHSHEEESNAVWRTSLQPNENISIGLNILRIDVKFILFLEYFKVPAKHLTLSTTPHHIDAGIMTTQQEVFILKDFCWEMIYLKGNSPLNMKTTTYKIFSLSTFFPNWILPIENFHFIIIIINQPVKFILQSVASGRFHFCLCEKIIWL